MLFVRYRRALEHLRFVLKPAIAFEFWSTLIFMVSFAPASGWLLNRLVAASGQYAVSDNDLLAFFLSSQGILFLILSVGFVLAFWFAPEFSSERIPTLQEVIDVARGRIKLNIELKFTWPEPRQGW